jgi:dCMP deaminase
MNQEREDRKHLELARALSRNSPDPSSKLGAVVTDDKGRVIGQGWNDFPKGIVQSEARWKNRDLKLKFVVHAEVNAILDADRATKGGTLYVYPGWGSPCMCTGCAKVAIQSGIKRVVGMIRTEDAERLARWKDELEVADLMCKEAGLEITIYNE